MSSQTQFPYGTTIVLRGVLRRRLWWAIPTYVVEDSAELVALYWRVGTPIIAPVGRPSVDDLLNNDIQLEKRHWVYNDILSLNVPGSGSSIELMWFGGTAVMRCWYVNLQESLQRTGIGFDTMDQVLDIIISPDRSDWHWKDEDEFSQAEAKGVYTVDEIRSIRAKGEQVISLMQANASPFCDGWEMWTPPEHWTIPQFPAGWENYPFDGITQDI